MRAGDDLKKQIEETVVDPMFEPAEALKDGDNIIGEISEYSRKIWCLLQMFSAGLDKFQEKLDEGDARNAWVLITASEKLMHQCGYLHQLFWLEALCALEDTYVDAWFDASTKTLGLREGWILVWREKDNKDDSEGEVEYEPENDSDKDDTDLPDLEEDDDDDIPPPASNTRH